MRTISIRTGVSTWEAKTCQREVTELDFDCLLTAQAGDPQTLVGSISSSSPALQPASIAAGLTRRPDAAAGSRSFFSVCFAFSASDFDEAVAVVLVQAVTVPSMRNTLGP